jgi:hypothetical protein
MVVVKTTPNASEVAIMLFSMILRGYGLGPPLAGMVSDALGGGGALRCTHRRDERGPAPGLRSLPARSENLSRRIERQGAGGCWQARTSGRVQRNPIGRSPAARCQRARMRTCSELGP